MSRLNNLTTLAARSAGRPLLTSAQVQAFNGAPLEPCPTCSNDHLALSHRGDWFCDECNTWLADPGDCPEELPPAASLFWSVGGLAVSDAEVERVVRYIVAVIYPDGEVIYPEGQIPPRYRRWWQGMPPGYDPFEEVTEDDARELEAAEAAGEE